MRVLAFRKRLSLVRGCKELPGKIRAGKRVRPARHRLLATDARKSAGLFAYVRYFLDSLSFKDGT